MFEKVETLTERFQSLIGVSTYEKDAFSDEQYFSVHFFTFSPVLYVMTCTVKKERKKENQTE